MEAAKARILEAMRLFVNDRRVRHWALLHYDLLP
jgi:hypothetical protein